MIITKEKKQIDITIEQYIETKNMIKELETQIENLKKEIVASMNGSDELITDYHKATNKEQIKDGIDLKQLKELFPDVYSKCFKPSIFPVLRVR